MKKIILIGLGLLSAMILMEIILHFTDITSYNKFHYDEKTGLLLYRPNINDGVLTSCFKNVAHINSLGFYGPEVPKEKENGEYRIIITGSSFVEAIQVPLNSRFDHLLEEKLNKNSNKKYRVVALGFSGNGTFLDMLYYKKYTESLHPDLVINLMTDYDLRVDDPEANHTSYFDEKGNVVTELPIIRRDSKTLFIKQTLRESKLIMNLYNKYLTARAVLKENKQPQDITESPIKGSWETEDKLLNKFNEVVKDSGAKFLLTSWTQNVLPDRNFMKENLDPIVEKNKINYFDLTSDMDKIQKETNKIPTWVCDGHWNKDGNEWVSEILYKYLTKNNYLLK